MTAHHRRTIKATWSAVGQLKDDAAKIRTQITGLRGHLGKALGTTGPAAKYLVEAEAVIENARRELRGESKRRIGVYVRARGRGALPPSSNLPPVEIIDARAAARLAEARESPSPKVRYDLIRLIESDHTSVEERRLRDQLASLDDRRNAEAREVLQKFVDDLEAELPELQAAANRATAPTRGLKTEIDALTAEADELDEQVRRMECALLGVPAEALV